MQNLIPFNKPYLSGQESQYIEQAVRSGRISGDGYFTQACHDYFQKKYHFKKCLLTHSCTAALEMAALLANIQPGDEVIMPSYTFVSTANAFVLHGAKVVFADSTVEHPNICPQSIVRKITKKTKALVIVHYAGIACQMDQILAICKAHQLLLIEDAAHAIDSTYEGKALGSFGDLACFSFHETKNIISGEGGMLVVNNESFLERAEILREKGTNRSAFFKGMVDKYTWVDIGSSFLPSDIIAAFLYAQLEKLEQIQEKRIALWNYYYQKLHHLIEKGIIVAQTPHYAKQNGHLFQLILPNMTQRDALIAALKKVGIQAVFHYLPLHKSPFYLKLCPEFALETLPNAEKFGDGLVRLPLFFELSWQQMDYIVAQVNLFFTKTWKEKRRG